MWLEVLFLAANCGTLAEIRAIAEQARQEWLLRGAMHLKGFHEAIFMRESTFFEGILP
jgi:hypothetical protein